MTNVPTENASFPRRGRFEAEYEAWKSKHPKAAAAAGHKRWLECVLPFLKSDTDHDGLPDWNAMVDRAPSRLLIPFDDDIDGDGLSNLLDPKPFTYGPVDLTAGLFDVPSHLKLAGEAKHPQHSLYSEYGLLALDHTDRHSHASLKALLEFLRGAVPRGLFTALPSVKVLYAYQGHDLRYDIAAYHRDMKAISLAGRSAFDGSSSDGLETLRLVSSFAHELGHAFAFDRLRAADLREIAIRFGGWERTASVSNDIYGDEFFRAHKLSGAARAIPEDKPGAARFVQDPRWARYNLVSQYATSNVHEWFAEAFSAHLISRWARARDAWPGRRPGLVLLPDRDDVYWVNFNNLSPEFRAWMDEKLRLH